MARVLVTGAAGFLGSAVCREAISRGDTATGLIRAGELVTPVPGVSYREMDWSSEHGIASVLSTARPDLVIHCAGATPRTGADIASAYDANVRLVWQLLAAIATTDLSPGVVIVSSAAVYAPEAPVPTAENAPLAPVSHYGWSKLLAEEAARAFAATESVRVCIARPFNMIGVGEPVGSVVSDVIAQLAANPKTDSVQVRGASSVRDFVDVQDAAGALIMLAEKGSPGKAYNVCGSEGTSVAELVTAILSTWNSSAEIVVVTPEAPSSTSIGSCNLLRSLGWRPRSNLEAVLLKLKASMT